MKNNYFGICLKISILAYACLLNLISVSTGFAETENKSDRHYFAIKGEVFFGHFSQAQGLKVYKSSYNQDDNLLKNKLAKKFKKNQRYNGLTTSYSQAQYVVKNTHTMPYYECMPECGAALELGKNSVTPLLLWTGELNVSSSKSKPCEINPDHNQIIDDHIAKAVEEYFKRYFPTNNKDEYGHKLTEKSCHIFDSASGKIIEVIVPIQVRYIPHENLDPHLGQYTPTFVFRIYQNKLKILSTYLSTECCGFHTGGNTFIDLILNIDGHDVVLYKWVGLESEGHAMMPFKKMLDSL